MRLRSIAFAGYRSFAARSPAAPERALERLRLAPLTILLGKNNSGKSTVARLIHHCLLALGSEGPDPFPMAAGGRTYGGSFREIQHNGAFFNPLDFELDLSTDEGAEAMVAAQLVTMSDSADDLVPSVRSRRFGGQTVPPGDGHGLLPDAAKTWRMGARGLLEASCYLGPIRAPIVPIYEVKRAAQGLGLPDGSDAVAQILLADVEVRMAVGDWMVKSLEGWRVDVRQSLDVFSLVAHRGGRDSNLAASGQGVQQVLPVAVLCTWRKLLRGQSPFLDVIEQPELHLHDAAHAPLGDLLLSAVASGSGNIVVETHSESLVLRVRRRVAEGLSPDKVALIYVEDTPEGSRLRPIPLRGDGEVEWWPEGVFSESFVEVKAIRRAQRASGGS